MQLLINDWCPISAPYPRGKDLEVELPDHSVCVAHWASDLSGEEQPPYQGWFTAETGGGRRVCYRQIPRPIAWRLLRVQT